MCFAAFYACTFILCKYILCSTFILIVNFSFYLCCFGTSSLLSLTAAVYSRLSFYHVFPIHTRPDHPHCFLLPNTQYCKGHPCKCPLVYLCEDFSGINTLSGLLATYFRSHYLCILHNRYFYSNIYQKEKST